MQKISYLPLFGTPCKTLKCLKHNCLSQMLFIWYTRITQGFYFLCEVKWVAEIIEKPCKMHKISYFPLFGAPWDPLICLKPSFLSQIHFIWYSRITQTFYFFHEVKWVAVTIEKPWKIQKIRHIPPLWCPLGYLHKSET